MRKTMVLTWLYVFIIIVPLIHPVISTRKVEHSLGHAHSATEQINDPSDWRVIEGLAEDHPYIVAMLNSMKDYLCTGSIITKQCVLTSGNCIHYGPKYVVSSAVHSKSVNNNSIFNIISTSVHADYIFELKNTDANATKLHSNMGLIYVDRPFLELFVNRAEIGNHYASELRGKQMTVIGYGFLGTPNLVALQSQTYLQVSCLNPKWYYCVCGKEYSLSGRTYMTEFGVGAPLLLEYVLVGIAAAPCGALSSDADTKYNIFTVIGPYLPWVEKNTKQNSTKRLVDGFPEERKRASKGVCRHRHLDLTYFYLFVLISKMVF